jgi:hypothetical protein
MSHTFETFYKICGGGPPALSRSTFGGATGQTRRLENFRSLAAARVAQLDARPTERMF